MSDTNNQLFFAGLFGGIVAGVLGALLMRRLGADEQAPFASAGLVLPRRAERAAEEAERAAAEALARARLAMGGAEL